MTLDISKINTTDLQTLRSSSGPKIQNDESNSIFDNQQKTMKQSEGILNQSESEKTEVVYLKNSTYSEVLKEKFGYNKTTGIISNIAPPNVILNGVSFAVERHRENSDFKKIANGELEGKQVFIDKKAFKAAKKANPENAKEMVYIRSSKGKMFVRDNAEKMELNVIGDYKSNAERMEEAQEKNHKEIELLKEQKSDKKLAKAEYKAAKKIAREEYKQSLKEAKERTNDEYQRFLDTQEY